MHLTLSLQEETEPEVTELRKIGLMVGVFVQYSRHGLEREGASMRPRGIVEGTRNEELRNFRFAAKWVYLHGNGVPKLFGKQLNS